MQDKYQRLYIRRQFEAKDLPSVAEIDVTGKWEAITKIDKKITRSLRTWFSRMRN